MIFARPIENIVPVALIIGVLALVFFIALQFMKDLFMSFFVDIKAWWLRRRMTAKPWRPSTHSLAVWAGRPAHWWQFWWPRSGIMGGAIAAVVLIIIACLLNRIFGA